MTRSDCLPDKRSIILYVSQFLKFISPSYSFNENKKIEKEQPIISNSFMNKDKSNNLFKQNDSYSESELSPLKPIVDWLNATLLDSKLNLSLIIEKQNRSKLDEYNVNF